MPCANRINVNLLPQKLLIERSWNWLGVDFLWTSKQHTQSWHNIGIPSEIETLRFYLSHNKKHVTIKKNDSITWAFQWDSKSWCRNGSDFQLVSAKENRKVSWSGTVRPRSCSWRSRHAPVVLRDSQRGPWVQFTMDECKLVRFSRKIQLFRF